MSECYSCHEELNDSPVYSVVITFKNDPEGEKTIVTDHMGLDNAECDLEFYRNKYTNDPSVESVNLSGRYCPHCLTTLS